MSLESKNIQALEWLSAVGRQTSDDDIDLLKGSIALAGLSKPNDYNFKNHFDYIDRLVQKLSTYPHETLEEKITALNDVLFVHSGFEGNYDDYDDLNNANMIEVFERKKGLPIAIGILYIYLARSQGWKIEGLSFPGHFIVRLTDDGMRQLIDPFNLGRILNASDLRQIVKAVMGQDQELSSSYYNAVSTRELLLRLQNNIKMRYIRDEAFDKALEQIEIMMLLAPDEEKLLFDSGILHYQLNNFELAVNLLEQYKERVPSSIEKEEVSMLIYEIGKLL